MIYLISYESNEMLHDYAPVVEAIKNIGQAQHPMDTLWFVKTTSHDSASSIYRIIKPLLRDKDHLFVIDISDAKNRQGWLSKTFWQWLKQG